MEPINNALTELKYGYFHSPIGLIEIAVRDNKIAGLSFTNEVPVKSTDDDVMVKECVQQLKKYFANELTQFDLPLVVKGTEFQELVWKQTSTIPFGTTQTYSDLATAIGMPKAVRAVGTALGRNPIAIIVPCHRIVNKNSNKINYGYGAEIKLFLLNLEKNSV